MQFFAHGIVLLAFLSELFFYRLYFFLEQGDFLVIKTSILGLEQSIVQEPFLLRRNLKQSSAYLGVFGEVCDFFKYLHLLLLVAFQESREFTLGKHCGAAKLTEVESHSLLHCLSHIRHLVASAFISLVGSDVVKQPCGRRETARSLFLQSSLHMPFRLIVVPVDTLECEYHVCLTRVATHQLARVVEGEVVTVVLHLGVLALLQSGSGAIEGQADGVENGGLAGSRLTSD